MAGGRLASMLTIAGPYHRLHAAGRSRVYKIVEGNLIVDAR